MRRMLLSTRDWLMDLRPLLTQALNQADAARRRFVQPHSGDDAAATFYEARGFARGVAAAREHVERQAVPQVEKLFDPSLPDPGRCHVSVARYAPSTAKEAARMAYPRSGTQRMRVLDLVAHRGQAGATDEEMQVRLGLGHNSQTPRRRELVLGGWIEDSGRTRPTGSTGAQATVWVLTEAGRHEWEAKR